MADTVAITAGSGTTIGTDEVTIGAVLQHVQRVKLVDGADGGTALIGGDATNGLDVDVTRVIPGTSATHLGKAEDAVHATGDTGVMLLAVRKATPVNLSGTDGDYEPLQVDGGKLWIAGAYAEDAAHVSGDAGVMLLAVRNDTAAALAGTTGDYIPLTTTSKGALWTTPVAGISGGCGSYRTIDLDETEEQVSATPCTLYGYFLTNLAASTRYIKFYDDDASVVVVGTTAPKLTIPLEADQAANFAFSVGIKFTTAMTIAATTGIADSDTGAPGTNDVVANVFYQT